MEERSIIEEMNIYVSIFMLIFFWFNNVCIKKDAIAANIKHDGR